MDGQSVLSLVEEETEARVVQQLVNEADGVPEVNSASFPAQDRGLINMTKPSDAFLLPNSEL